MGEMIILPIKQRVKSACEISGMTLTELANKLGTSQQNLSKRLDNGKLSQDDYIAIANALGCEYISWFCFPNGTKV